MVSQDQPQAEPPLDPSQFVDLAQIAAMVKISRPALRRHYLKLMPPPYRIGRGRRPYLWYWPAVRPWLAERFGMPLLPEKFPDVHKD